MMKEKDSILDDAAEILKKKASEFNQEELKDYIQENPLKSAIIALGVGVVLGFILKPSSK